MFDNLYVLAEGQCIYQGLVNGLVPFLASIGLECPSYHNPANYVMEVACGEHGDWNSKLVTAVTNGKCNNYNQPVIARGKSQKSIDLEEDQPVDKIVSGLGAGEDDLVKRSTVEFTTVNIEPLNNESKFSSSAVISSSKTTSDDAVGTSTTVVVSSGKGTEDGAVTTAAPSGNGKPPPASSKATCTTSLLDSTESVSIAVPKKLTGFPTSGWMQFWILLKRTFITIMRDQTLTQMRLVSHVVVGAIIGMIYYDIGNDAAKIMSNAGCIFFTTMFTMFTAMMPTILTFPTEMAVFVREHLNYWYSLKSFYFAKTVADLPFQVLFTSVYVIVVYYLTSQPMEPKRAGMFVLICILTSLVAQSLGLLIGAGMSVETGVFLGPVSTIPIILFSGFFVNFDVIPKYLQWLTYVSYVRYGFEGAMVSVYGMDRAKLACEEMYCHYRSPQKFLEEMSMDKAEYWIDATALFCLFIGLRVVAYLVLRWKLHSIR